MLRAIYAIIAGIVMQITVIPIGFLVTGFNLGFNVAFGKSIHLLTNAIFQGPVIGIFTWVVILIFRKAEPYIIFTVIFNDISRPFFRLLYRSSATAISIHINDLGNCI
jgi:hypothetical protein